MKNKVTKNHLLYLLLPFFALLGFFYVTFLYNPPLKEQAKEKYGLTKVKNGDGIEKYLVHYGTKYDPNYAKSRGVSSGQIIKEFKNLKKAEEFLENLRKDFINQHNEKKKIEFK